MLFRSDDQAKRFYVFDMLIGWQAVAIRRVEADAAGNFGDTKLSVVNYPLQHQQSYAVTIAARGHSITTYVYPC